MYSTVAWAEEYGKSTNEVAAKEGSQRAARAGVNGGSVGRGGAYSSETGGRKEGARVGAEVGGEWARWLNKRMNQQFKGLQEACYQRNTGVASGTGVANTKVGG